MASNKEVEFNPLSPEILNNPISALAEVREATPVYKVPSMGIYMVTRYDAIQEVLKKPTLFSNAHLASVFSRSESPEVKAVRAEGYDDGHSVPVLDPPEHTSYRRMWNDVFFPRFRKLNEPITKVVNDYIDEFSTERPVDFVEEFAGPVSVGVMAETLGLPRSDVGILKRFADLGVEAMGGTLTLEEELERVRFTVNFQNYIVENIEKRKTDGTDNLLSDISKATMDGEPIVMADKLAMASALLTAGTETTSKMIATGLKLLLDHPDQFEAVLEDRSLVPNLVEEVLRHEGPVKGLFRIALEDTEVAGIPIPKGAHLQLMWMSANRDEKQFEQADVFDVRRKNARKHLAFGGGIHNCIGSPMARMEGEIAFNILFDRVHDIRLSDKNDFARAPSAIMWGLKHLYIDIGSIDPRID